MSEEEKLLKEAKKLPWEDRLFHKNWKVRNEANIDLASLCDSITDPKDSRIREFGRCFFPLRLGFLSFRIRFSISIWWIWMRFSAELLFAKVHFRLDLDAWFCSLFFFFEFGRTFFQKDSGGFKCAGAGEGAGCFDCLLASCGCRRWEVRISLLLVFGFVICLHVFVLKKLPFVFKFKFEFEFRSRYGKEVCDAVVAKCLTGRPKTVEKAQAVFLLWVELEAVDAFLVPFI